MTRSHSYYTGMIELNKEIQKSLKRHQFARNATTFRGEDELLNCNFIRPGRNSSYIDVVTINYYSPLDRQEQLVSERRIEVRIELGVEYRPVFEHAMRRGGGKREETLTVNDASFRMPPSMNAQMSEILQTPARLRSSNFQLLIVLANTDGHALFDRYFQAFELMGDKFFGQFVDSFPFQLLTVNDLQKLDADLPFAFEEQFKASPYRLSTAAEQFWLTEGHADKAKAFKEFRQNLGSRKQDTFCPLPPSSP